MKDLFLGTGIAHSILLFAIVIAVGLWLGKFKVKGISIGSTWILFVGIILSHFGFISNPTVLSFVKDFGLILFVFSIGLQVGPGFFQSFKKGGVVMNLLAVVLVLLAVLTTFIVHIVTGEDLKIMTGVMSAAVTNTPGLGAAQQTLSDVIMAEGGSHEAASAATSQLASAYAVAYPIGVIGVIFLIIIFKGIFRIDTEKEIKSIELQEGAVNSARRMHCLVENPAIFDRSIKDVLKGVHEDLVISRLMRNGEILAPNEATILKPGDKVLIVTKNQYVDQVRVLFGKEVPLHVQDWNRMSKQIISKKLTITKHSITGKRISDLNIRSLYGVSITRVIRSGMELVAMPNLRLQVGDVLLAVGEEEAIKAVAELIGNKLQSLFHPNLVPIFFGIAIGVIFGSIPISFPGIPQPIKLGLAGGPLIVAILLGYFGPKWRITTYTTLSANMMLREIGISFFMAAVGLGAGESFISSLLGGGYWWILYGAIITIVPVSIIMIISRLIFKLNFYQICGLVTGGTTNPPVLAFAQGAYGTDYTSVNYATVYPLTMFMRVLVAQLLILFAI